MQVPLGVIPKDEIKHEDMIDILCRELIDPVTKDAMILKDHILVTTLVGGDQLTTARARGAQLIQSDYDSSKDRLAGLLPVTEDWHAKMCLMKVISYMHVLCVHNNINCRRWNRPPPFCILLIIFNSLL